MKYIDIHTHKVKAADDEIIVSSLSVDEWEESLQPSDTRFFSLGVHPWDVEKVGEKELLLLEKFAADDAVRLIGECGMDKNCDVPFETQEAIFRRQAEISERLQKPLIIHCVGFFNELFQLRKELKTEQEWIVHGFRGKPQLAQQALRAGLSLSFGERFNPESVLVCPLEKLYVETDESELPIAEIYDRLARIKECSPADLTRAAAKLLEC